MISAFVLSLVGSVVVMPIHAASAPPQDPTLLRLSRTVVEAIHDAIGEDVRLVSREQRDEFCPREDGSCPNEIAALLEADEAIALVLAKDFTSLKVRVFKGKSGVDREGAIPCTWSEGSVSCETEKIAKIFEGAGPAALGTKEVDDAFALLAPKLEHCRSLDTEASPPEAWVSFRVRADGRVYDVRIDPRELVDRKGFGCVATTVESLTVRKFSGSTQTYRYSLLPEKPKPAPKKKARKK